jgi:hypothetical protein
MVQGSPRLKFAGWLERNCKKSYLPGIPSRRATGGRATPAGPLVTETVARRMGWRRVGDVARTSRPASFGPASYARGRMCGTRYPKFTQPPTACDVHHRGTLRSRITSESKARTRETTIKQKILSAVYCWLRSRYPLRLRPLRRSARGLIGSVWWKSSSTG